jgi:hypothetical protein
VRWPAPRCCPGGSRCAVGAGLAPSHAEGVDFFGRLDPGRGKTFRLALEGEEKLRPFLAGAAQGIMATIAAGGPEMLPEPGQPAPPGSARAIDDPVAMARLRATFAGSLDGWTDDQLAAVHPWGFDVAEIATPVGNLARLTRHPHATRPLRLADRRHPHSQTLRLRRLART